MQTKPKSGYSSLILPAMLSLGVLAGCQATGMGIEPSFNASGAFDLALPENVAFVPFASSEPEPNALTVAAQAVPVPEATDAGLARTAAVGDAGPDAGPLVRADSFAAVETPEKFAVAAPSGRPEIDRLIEKYALVYEVPVDLVRRVVKRESTFNPNAYNNGHWGLMQIKHATARGMGYQGPARGLLDPETNLKYAVKYLRGAYMVAGGNHDRADRMYQRGYYYDAKRAGLLDETGLGRDRVRRRRG